MVKLIGLFDLQRKIYLSLCLDIHKGLNGHLEIVVP